MGCDYDALNDPLITDEMGQMSDVEQLRALVHQLVETGMFLLNHVDPDSMRYEDMKQSALYLDWAHQSVCVTARVSIEDQLGKPLQRPVDYNDEDTEPQELHPIFAILTKDHLN